MTRRRAPAPSPALRALASIPLAGALVACSPAREEPPLPAGVPSATSASVPATVPGLIAAGEILVDAAQSPRVPMVSMPPTRRCLTSGSSNTRSRTETDGGATGCAAIRP